LILHPLRLSNKDYEKLKCASENVGLNKSEYLRRLINEQEVRPKPPDSYSKLAWKYGRICFSRRCRDCHFSIEENI